MEAYSHVTRFKQFMKEHEKCVAYFCYSIRLIRDLILPKLSLSRSYSGNSTSNACNRTGSQTGPSEDIPNSSRISRPSSQFIFKKTHPGLFLAANKFRPTFSWKINMFAAIFIGVYLGEDSKNQLPRDCHSSSSLLS